MVKAFHILFVDDFTKCLLLPFLEKIKQNAFIQQNTRTTFKSILHPQYVTSSYELGVVKGLKCALTDFFRDSSRPITVKFA